jgi:hypothetical protein
MMRREARKNQGYKEKRGNVKAKEGKESMKKFT